MRNELNALGGRVRALVKLTGKILHGKNGRAVVFKLFKGDIELRLGKNSPDRIIKKLFCNVFRVVAVYNADVRNAFYLQKRADVRKQSLCLGGKLFLFFGVNSVYHSVFLRFAKRFCADIFSPEGVFKVDMVNLFIGAV